MAEVPPSDEVKEEFLKRWNKDLEEYRPEFLIAYSCCGLLIGILIGVLILYVIFGR